jgi:hypothetical protein
MDSLLTTKRTQVNRLPKRGAYDRLTANAILDEGLVCHAGFMSDGLPYVIPTGYVRDGERLLLHGSAASRMMRVMAGGVDLCITVTLVDGLVLARSAFHHSVNYRSVVVFGRGEAVQDADAKMEALRLFTEHMVPGRWNEVRLPTAQELKGTLVIAVPIEEGSVKVRTGPPLDDAEDMEFPVWAGVLPLRLQTSALIPDEKNTQPEPAYLTGYKR